MDKKVYIIHGWGGYPGEGWFPWLKRELENRGFKVFILQMPKSEEPRINNWVSYLGSMVNNLDDQTYFVGHSMGCQAIARYLEKITGNKKIGGVVFVAGFFKRLTNLKDDGIVSSVVEEWLKTPIDLSMVERHINKSVALFSDNDPYVPLDNQGDFKNTLNSKIIIEHDMKHFSGTTGTVKLPIVLDLILELMK